MNFNNFTVLFFVIFFICTTQEYIDLSEINEKNQTLIYSISRDEMENNEISEEEEDIIIQEKPIVICLGQSCFALLKIREFGLRSLAYPFDWNVIYNDTLIELIKNDFSQLLDEHFIHFENHTRIWNILYGGGIELQHGLTWAHICSPEATKENFFQNFFPKIKERMQRRIRRFYKALNSGKHVYFVRGQVPLGNHMDVSRENTFNLVELIKFKFPKLKFTLIAVNFIEDCKIDWQIPNVVNFYHSGLDNEENSQTWKKIFKSVGLL